MKALVCLWLLLGSLQALAAPSSTGNGATVPWDLSKPLNGITFERVLQAYSSGALSVAA